MSTVGCPHGPTTGADCPRCAADRAAHDRASATFSAALDTLQDRQRQELERLGRNIGENLPMGMDPHYRELAASYIARRLVEALAPQRPTRSAP